MSWGDKCLTSLELCSKMFDYWRTFIMAMGTISVFVAGRTCSGAMSPIWCLLVTVNRKPWFETATHMPQFILANQKPQFILANQKPKFETANQKSEINVHIYLFTLKKTQFLYIDQTKTWLELLYWGRCKATSCAPQSCILSNHVPNWPPRSSAPASEWMSQSHHGALWLAPPQNLCLCSPLSPPLDEAGAFCVCRLPNPKSQMTQEMKVAGLASGGSQVGLVADTDVSYFCSCTLILPASALKWIPPPLPWFRHERRASGDKWHRGAAQARTFT